MREDRPESVRVVALKVRDFKRIEAFEATFNPGLTLLAGPNGSGKSSVLDSIVAALGCKRQHPPRPVRDGAGESEVVLDLDPYVVRRTFRVGGETTLSVERRDGQAVPAPQTFLDDLCGRGEVFDPLAPLRERPERLAEILRDLAGLDFRELDNRRAHLYARRTEVGRSLRTVEGAVRMMPHHPAVPADPIDVKPLNLEQEVAFRQLGRHERLKGRLKMIDTEDVRERETLRELERKVVESRARLERLSVEHSETSEKLAQNPEPDIDAIQVRIRAAQDVNAQVAENRERAAREAAAAEHRARVEELTAEIDVIDRDKAARLEVARYPVEGLSVEDDRVLLDGLPLEQASSGQRLEFGLALAAALRPGLRTLLVREGSLLDADALARVRAWAEARDVSVLLEVVESEPGALPGAIEIREGRIATFETVPLLAQTFDRVAREIDQAPLGARVSLAPDDSGSQALRDGPPSRAGRPARKARGGLFPEEAGS